ncbi:hypothetical protein [Bordetella petrii]|uniref:hypothetical protein n=1 Tax=Bordetella petrii TaxID=94624 RepID=UPI0004ADDB7B|nr:hypothetical protein [Bordetella petrii]
MDVRSLERSGKVAALRGGGELLLIGPNHVFDGIAPALIIRDASRLRAVLYPHLRNDSSLTKLATLYRQLVCTGSVGGHYSPQQTTDQMVTLMQYGHIAAVALPDTSGNDGTGNTQPISPAENPPGPVSQWSLADRFGYVLRHSTEHMSDAMAREVRDKLLDPGTLATIVGVLVVWAGSHAVGVGFVADAALLAIGFALAGWAIFDGIKYLARFFNLTMNASSERELNEAARQFAEGVTAIGVGALIGLLTRGASRLAPRPVGRSTPRPAAETPQTPRQAADTTAAKGPSTRPWSPSRTAQDKIPKDWGEGLPNRKGAGYRWQDPSNPGNGVRIDQGNPLSTYPTQQVDHVVVRSNGRVLGRDGLPLPGTGSVKANPELSHIPLSEYEKWKTWNTPD